jgi:hypothetical protein
LWDVYERERERTTFKVEGGKTWQCRIKYVELILEEVWERTSQELLRLLDVKIGKLLSKLATIQIDGKNSAFRSAV